MQDSSEDICYFCNEGNDTAMHQLFHCHSVIDNTYSKLIEELKNAAKENSDPYYIDRYVYYVLTYKSSIQDAFIERVKFLLNRHELQSSLSY